jgi:3'-phosphoadenosine 5'-phosphosulfate sulfotransferase (PAPS reductase)/FAD synthetase
LSGPDLAGFDVVVVNSSAGKDSQAMLDLVVERADAAGVRGRVVVLHCDLGNSPKGHPIEWPGTKELAEEHARHYGLRFVVVKRGGGGLLEKVEQIGFWPRSSTRYCTSFFKRDQGQKAVNALAKEARGFLEEVERRGKWPSSGQRYCTSYYKRDAAGPAITALAGEERASANKRPRILQCFGFRAQESPRRKKMPVFAEDKRISNSRKEVMVWLPIHEWPVEQVWGRIRAAGTRHHPAYDLGMTRLSCSFCIFAPKSQLMVAARARPELFAEYVELERKIGHTFRKELPLAEVQRAVEAGESPRPDDGAWNM